MKDFIKGLFVISLIIPLIDGAINLYNQWIKYICTDIAVKTYQLEESIPKEENQQTFAMGFQYPVQQNYEECEYEEEDD